MNRVVKVGFVMDQWYVYNGGIAKYSGVVLLLKSMLSDPRYEPYLVTTSRVIGNDKEGRFNRPFIDKIKSLGVNVISFEEANSGKVDFFVFTCPYRQVYKEAKIPYIYSEYGMDSVNDDITLTTRYKGIYQKAHTILVSNKAKKLELISKGFISNIIDRKPNYDYALKKVSRPFDEKYKYVVMYAPHHSVAPDNSADDYKRFSTWYGYKDRFIELVDQGKGNTLFIYKPHPFLDKTASEHADYKATLSKKENVLILGGDKDYYEYFMYSDLMITDCISFISEWLPRKKPLIRLKDSSSSEYSSRAEKLVSDCYMNFNIDSSEMDLSEMISIVDNFDDKLQNFDKYLRDVTVPGQSNCEYILEEFYRSISR